MANATTSGDLQLAAAAAGFSLGFGLLTVVRAYKQTRANRAPSRSVYICTSRRAPIESYHVASSLSRAFQIMLAQELC